MRVAHYLQKDLMCPWRNHRGNSFADPPGRVCHFAVSLGDHLSKQAQILPSATRYCLTWPYVCGAHVLPSSLCLPRSPHVGTIGCIAMRPTHPPLLRRISSPARELRFRNMDLLSARVDVVDTVPRWRRHKGLSSHSSNV